MNIQSPFTFINSLVKQITDSWTTHKTGNIAYEKRTTSVEVVHEPVPVAKGKESPVKTIHIPMESSHANDYCSTY